MLESNCPRCPLTFLEDMIISVIVVGTLGRKEENYNFDQSGEVAVSVRVTQTLYVGFESCENRDQKITRESKILKQNLIIKEREVLNPSLQRIFISSS